MFKKPTAVAGELGHVHDRPERRLAEGLAYLLLDRFELGVLVVRLQTAGPRFPHALPGLDQ